MTRPQSRRESSWSAVPGPLGAGPRPLRAAFNRSVRPLARLLAEVSLRALDVALSLAGLVALSPFLLLRAIMAKARAGHMLERKACLGRLRTPFMRLEFAGSTPGRSLPVLLNILRGEMSFVGPRALLSDGSSGAAPSRFEVRPGLVSSFTLRRRTGMVSEGEDAMAHDFVYSETLKADLGLLARAVPATLLGSSELAEPPPQFDIFGIRITNSTMEEALDWIEGRIANAEACQVAFVNPDCLNIAYQHREYLGVVRHLERVLPDGIGLQLACRMMGTSLRANLNGTDLFPRLCERLAGSGESVFLLGARPGIAEAAGRAMQERFPELEIAGSHDGYFSPKEESAIIDEVNASRASVLLLALGAPRQDLWLAQHRADLQPAVVMGVGGLFDYYSGSIARAPEWMREIGLEWTWRLLQEPGRLWRRYLIGNPLFLWRVWKDTRSVEASP